MIGGHRVVALVLSGGGGTRLWPASTTAQPKQFLKLFGQRSLYQRTVGRLSAAAVDEVVVVANAEHEALLQAQTAAIGFPAPTLVLEPMRRDSAPAITAGVVATLAQYGPDAIVAVLPCDHLIPDEAHFARSLAEAVELAALGYLGTFGIQPTFPSTEYGYIQRGPRLTEHASAYRVAKFHEKPKLALASGYLADGGYDWNSGMFVFSAGVFAREAQRHMPDIWQVATASLRNGPQGGRRLALAAEIFGKARKTSIDYALFEKSENVGVVPVTFAWSDIGNWSSVYDMLDKDMAKNALVGDAAVHDVSGSLVIGDGANVILVGVKDLVVVTTTHGTFVAPLSRAAEVKALIEAHEQPPDVALHDKATA